MDTSPLVIDEIDAGKEFLMRLDSYQKVIAGCWLLRSDDEERYLYAALDGLIPGDSDAAYDEVLRITEEMTDFYIDPFRVRLITPDNPIAQAIIKFHRQYPGRTPPRHPGGSFAGMSPAEVYIYSPISHTTQQNAQP